MQQISLHKISILWDKTDILYYIVTIVNYYFGLPAVISLKIYILNILKHNKSTPKKTLLFVLLYIFVCPHASFLFVCYILISKTHKCQVAHVFFKWTD